MAGNIEKDTLQTELIMEGKQPLNLLDSLEKQIKELSRLGRNIKLGITKGDLKSIQDSLNNLRFLRKHIEDFKGVSGQSATAISNIADRFKYLSNILVPLKSRLKAINQEMASIRTGYAGIDTLYNKAMYQGKRDYLLYGSTSGQTFQQNKLIETEEKINRKNWERANPAAAQAAKNQEDLNRAIYRATNLLPTYQLYIMANYAAINKLVGGYKYLLNYTVQYDEELHQLQAISGTTTGTLKQMQNAIEDVAATTEFTSLELAKASTVLAQAGLSATQIEGTLPAIAKLATATGTDLNTSVETITSTLNIYNLQTSEAEHVTNALTTAMNESKANIAGFQQAIQYAGNLASQLGISFDETAAAISAAAQAGIRSKSMLGTGMRATLTEMLKPTKKFQEQLASVGLTIDDIDVKSRGYVNVLKTLKEAGFGAEQAFKGMDRRAAAFLVTQIRQTDFMQQLRSSMASSTAASKANEIQMDSLAKQYKTFQNNVANAATNGLEPFIRMLSNLLKLLNQLFNTPGVKQVLGTLLTGVAVGGGLKTLQLSFNALVNMAKALSASSVSTSLIKFTNFFKIATSNAPVMMRLIAAFRGLFSLPGLTILSVLGSTVYALGDAFGWWQSNLEKANEEMERAKGEAEEAKNKLSGVQDLLQRVYDQKEKLQDQTERDIFVREILSKYPEISKYIDDVTMSYQDLIEAVKTLNTLTKSEVAEKAAKEAESMLKSERARIKEEALGLTPKGVESFLARTSFSQFSTIDPYGYYAGGNALRRYAPGSEPFEKTFTREGAKNFGRDFDRTVKDILDEAKKQGKEVLYNEMAKLEGEIALSGDDALKQMTKIITERYRKQIEAEEMAASAAQSQVDEFARKNVESVNKIYQEIDEAEKALELYKEQVKQTGVSSVDLASHLDLLNKRLANTAPIYDKTTGEPLALNRYTLQQSADRFAGGDIQAYENMIREYVNKLGEEDKARTANLDDLIKEYNERFLSTLEQYSDFSMDLAREIGNLAKAINKQSDGEGSVEYIGRSSKLFSDLHIFSSKASNFSKSKKDVGFKDLQSKSDRAIRAQFAEISNRYRSQFSYVSPYDKSGKLKSEESYIREAKQVLETAGLSGDALNKELKTVANGFNSVKTAVNEANKTITTTATVTGPKFDVAAEKLNKFFKDLEADINKTETAYLNAEKALDSVLAKQKGRVTAAGLAFGKNSGIVEYEQRQLEDLEDSQRAARLTNLIEKRKGLGQAYASLVGNADYKNVTERYQKAYDQYNNALSRGNYKEADAARKIMNTLGSANKKYTDEEKKLTQEISKLDKDIIELDYTIHDTELLKQLGPGTQMSLGWRAATGNYINSIKDSGLTTIAGSMEYLSTQTIDAFDNSMTTMFQNIANGSQRAGDAFKEFGRKIIETIRDVAIQMAVKQGLTMLFSAFGGSSGGIEESGGSSSSFATYSISKAVGGLVKGPVKNRDSVPTMLMPGEFVMKKSAVDTIGKDYLEGLNANASAMMESASQSIGESKSATTTDSAGAGGVVNVYVVGQEQQQSMTPNDVIVTISQDMLKGGQTKRLVKSIAMGSI